MHNTIYLVVKLVIMNLLKIQVLSNILYTKQDLA